MDFNLLSYSQPDAVRGYAEASKLSKCEAYLFEKYINRTDAILDVGVGGGRTSEFIAGKAGTYVGLDYSPAMVEACRQRYPKLNFVCGDATRLDLFPDETFDVAVFSLNGIDSLPTDGQRARCFREASRVLRKGGRFIFSSHNAASVGFVAKISETWYRMRLREELFPEVRKMGLATVLLRILRSFRISSTIWFRRLFVGRMHHGTGYVYDRSHGGLILFVSTPECIRQEAQAAGFQVIEIVNANHPFDPPSFVTQWYYYVLRKV